MQGVEGGGREKCRVEGSERKEESNHVNSNTVSLVPALTQSARE